MVNRPFRMNLQCSSPVAPCIRRVIHKRSDSDDQPPAKCARSSPDSGDPQGLLGTSPSSPVSPTVNPIPTTHQGPSRIGAFLSSPSADRESSHGAMNTDTGDESSCKVFDMGAYQEKIRAYGVSPPHRNVAGIRDIISGERKAYIFLDKDFGDMHTSVKSCRRSDEEQARRSYRQVVLAVAHCHQAGIVSGDLKLRKFVFADEKRTHVRLESLEDCRILEDPNRDSMSDTHGCPAYVSPEILSGSTPYSGKMADMWSLGVILYTMLVGRYPFHDPDPATSFSKIRRGQCCLPEGLSPKAKCLLQSSSRKEPSERLTAAESLAHPWFNSPSVPQDVASGEQEVSSAEQTVPSFEVEEEEDSFC